MRQSIERFERSAAIERLERFEPTKGVERLERASKSGAVDAFLKRDDICEESKRKLHIDNTACFYALE